jgi:hypothetical protein
MIFPTHGSLGNYIRFTYSFKNIFIVLLLLKFNLFILSENGLTEILMF